MLWMVSANILKSLRLAPATHKPTGTPPASTSNERLVPCLLRSVGLGPVFFPRQGCFGHRPIHREPTPVDAVEGVVLGQPGLPETQKEAVLDPRLKAVVGRRAWANAGSRERVPLATGSRARKRCRPHTLDPARAAARPQSGACFCAPARAVPSTPKAHR